MKASLSDSLFDRQLAADAARVSALRAAYQQKLLSMGQFVEQLAQWKIFGTFTFRWASSVDSAKRCFERFLSAHLPRKVSVFWVVEIHPGGHGAHIHALFDRDDWPCVEMWRAWFKRYGRARIDRLRSFRGRDYCASKYVCKDTSWWSYRLSKQNFSHALRSSPCPKGGADPRFPAGTVPPDFSVSGLSGLRSKDLPSSVPEGAPVKGAGGGSCITTQSAHSSGHESAHTSAPLVSVSR